MRPDNRYSRTSALMSGEEEDNRSNDNAKNPEQRVDAVMQRRGVWIRGRSCRLELDRMLKDDFALALSALERDRKLLGYENGERAESEPDQDKHGKRAAR